MSNSTTASDWASGAADIEAQIKTNNDSIASLLREKERLAEKEYELIQKKLALPTPATQLYVQLYEIDPIQREIEQLDNKVAQLTQQNQQLRNQANGAQTQASIASSGPGLDNTNTPPASDLPGDNSDPAPLPGATTPSLDAPVTEFDEFGDLDAAVDANSGLQEPPLLDEDELEAELGRAQADADEAIASYGTEAPTVSDELTVPPGTDTEEEGRQPGLAEPTEQDVLAATTVARNTGNAPPTPFPTSDDWRVRLSLAPGAKYFYQAEDPGILLPLKSTKGVLFPYTPQINITYSANYDQTDVAHSNYRLYNYKNSAVENISITADFTAQDTYEANYVLAVIHFFRSVTKMFYGKDQQPVRGVPPPLVYITGHGAYNFDNQPLAITSFTMTYPNDVDYINAGNNVGGTTGLSYFKPTLPFNNTPLGRLLGSKLMPGGLPPPPRFAQVSGGPEAVNTRIPTKLSIQLSAIPMMSRYSVSNQFSLKDYASGRLMRGSKVPGGGFW